MSNYQCPRCNRVSMDWDGRAKVLMCYFQSCRHVIRMQNYDRIPAPEEIKVAIVDDRSETNHRWGDFKDYCEDTGISLEYEEDWSAWWDCWKAAIDSSK